MCQFNLIFVKNDKNKKILEKENYSLFNNTRYKDYSGYAQGICDCNSFVGSMSEYNGNSYSEMLETSNKSELTNLYKIKDLMNSPNYAKLKQNFISTKESLIEATYSFMNELSDYKMEQLKLLEKKYKDKELQKQIKLLHKELDKKREKIESSPEFKAAEAKLNNYIEQNKLMNESTYYYLTKEEEDGELHHIPTDEFIEEFENTDDFNDELNDFPQLTIFPEEESLVIDTVIKKLEANDKYQNDYPFFMEYKQLFKKLLENEEYILFGCIFDSPGEFTETKTININDITIEDLAKLEFDEILKIHS